MLVVSPFLISVHAEEPSLTTIINTLGFTNVTETTVETFPAGTYEITLYAEFAGYSDENELSYYEVGTSVFNVIFTGPEGGSGYINPPVTKSFTADYEIGLSMLSPGPHRYFTETSRNGDGIQHSKVYENLDDPSMFLIGFENQWGGGDKDYNDMVFSLKPKQPPVALFDYSPLYPVANETTTFNASDSYDPDGYIVSYQWDFGDGNITTVNDPIITHIYTTANSTMNYTVTLTVTDNDGLTNSTTVTVPVTNPAILHVSIPAGEDRTGISDPDPWLNECWLLNITGVSGTFTVRIEDVSRCISSYDTHLVIALNDAAHNNLVSLSVNGTPIVKNDFKYGTLRPYDLWNWPSGDVYPTWFNDTLVNVGTIPPKGHVNVTVSVTFSNATGVGMHFDAYGSKKSSPIPPTKKCYITHNPLSEDSTVLFWPPPVVKYYLRVISPYGTSGGEGWYDNCTYAYATLNAGIVDHGNGTRRVFTHWSGDASGTNYASSDPIHMNQNKTAIANWKTQYYLTLVTNPSGITTPSGEGWYDADTYAPISTPEFVTGGSRYRFTGWTTSDMSEIIDPASTSTTVLMDKPKTVTANYIVQYKVTFTYTGLSSDATGTVVTVNGSAKTFGDLPFEIWVDTGNVLTYSYEATVSSTISGKRYRLDSVTGPTSPITVTVDTTVTGNYVTQYQVTFDQTGLDATATGTVVTVNGDTKTFSDLPYTTWVDSGDSVSYSYSDPVSSSVGGKRFRLVDVTGPTSPIAVTGSVTVTGNYKIQYAVTFDQSGVGSDFTGTVVVIDATDYGFGDLPVSFWWDAGSSHDFAFESPLVVTPDGKRYVWTSTSGLSSLQSGSITVSASGTVTGNYGTQYYLTVTSPYDSPTPSSGWFDDGDEITASVTSPWPGATGIRYVCTGWIGTGSVPASGSTASVTFTIDTPSSITWTWKTQYYLTVNTDPTGLSPAPTPSSGWHDEGTNVQLTAPDPSYKNSIEYSFKYWKVDGVSQGSGVKQITVLMDEPHTSTAYYETAAPPPPPQPVGGYAVPIDIGIGKEVSHLLASQIGLAFALIAAMAATILLTKRRSKTLK